MACKRHLFYVYLCFYVPHYAFALQMPKSNDQLHNVLVPFSGVSEEVSLGSSSHTSQWDREDPESKWILMTENLVIEVGHDFLQLRDVNTSVIFDKIQCGGEAKSVTAFGTRVLVHVQNTNKNYLVVYSHAETSNLVEENKELINYEPEKIKALDSHVVVSTGRYVYTYEYYPRGGFKPIDYTQFHDDVKDVAIVNDDDEYLAAFVTAGYVHLFAIHTASGMRPLQFLQSIAATSVESLHTFTSVLHQYLAVDGPQGGVWRLDGKEDMSKILTNQDEPRQWLPIPLATYRHDVLLLVKTKDEVAVWVSNGASNFKKMGDFSSLCGGQLDCQKLEKEVDLSKSTAAEGSVLLFTERTVFLLKLDYSLDMKPSLDWERKLMDAIEDQDSRSARIISRKTHNLDPEIAESLNETWSIGVLESTDAEFEPSESDEGEFEVEDWSFAGRDDWTEEDMKIDLTALDADVKAFLRELQEVREEVHLLAFEEEELDEKINTGLRVNGNVFAERVTVEYLNDQAKLFVSWIDDLTRNGETGPIYGTKEFQSITAQEMLVSNLNDITASDLLYPDHVLHIKGDLILESDVTVSGDILVDDDGTVNGLILKDDLLLVDVPFTGSPKFDSLKVSDHSKLMEVAVPNRPRPVIVPVRLSPQDVDPATLQIDEVNVQQQFMVENINGIPVQDFLGPLDDSANKTHSVSSVSVEFLNGIPFPSGYVRSSISSPISMMGEKDFSHLKVKNLKVKDDFLSNDVDGEEMVELKESREGKLTYVFESGLVAKTVTADEVHGLEELTGSPKLSERKDTLVKCNILKSILDNEVEDYDYDESDGQSFTANVVEIIGSLSTPGEISSHATGPLARYLSKTKNQTIPAQILPNKLLIVDNLIIEEPMDVKNVLRETDEFSEVKIFGKLDVEDIYFEETEIHVEEILVDGLVDGVNFQALRNDSVLKSDINIFVSGTKQFLNGLEVQNMSIHTLNGHRPATIATTEGDYIFKGPVTFYGDVQVGQDLNALGTFNGVNLTDLALKVSTKYRAFLVAGDLELGGNVTVAKLVVDGSVQGVNLTEFLEDSVSVKGVDSGVSPNVTFLDKVFIGDLNVSGVVNGLNLTDFLQNVVLLDRAVFLTNLTLQNSTEFAFLNVGELTAASVKNCDVDRWKQDAVFMNEGSFSPNHLKIESLTVEGDIIVDHMNGVSPFKLIKLKGSETLPISIRIRELTVKEDIAVQHLVNGQNLLELWKDSLRSNASQNVTGHKHFLGDVKCMQSINTTQVNGIALDDMVTLDTPQNISSPLFFSNLSVMEGLDVDGTVSGVDVANWWQRVFLPATAQSVNGSWSVAGNISILGDVEGSGLISNVSLRNVSRSLDQKLKRADELNCLVAENYQEQCHAVAHALEETKFGPRVLDMFEDIQSIEFRISVNSVISYQVNGKDFILITFLGRCSCSLYEWRPREGKFFISSRVKIGAISRWDVISVTLNGSSITSQYLVTSGPRACHSLAATGNVWRLTEHGPEHLMNVEPFQDVMGVNETDTAFYTVTLNGSVSAWSWTQNGLLSNRTVNTFTPGVYKFIPMSLGYGLALWNNDRIFYVNQPDSHDIRLPGAYVASSNSESSLIALSDGVGRVKVVDMDRNRTVVASLHISVPTDLLWIDLESPGELYLVFASEHHRIYVSQYKGASGLVTKSILPYPSSQLSLIYLPHANNIPTPHLVLIHHREIHILQAQIHGEPGLRLTLHCP